MYIYYDMSPNSSLNDIFFPHECCRENKKTHFQVFFFPEIVPFFCDNVEKYGTAMTRPK